MNSQTRLTDFCVENSRYNTFFRILDLCMAQYDAIVLDMEKNQHSHFSSSNTHTYSHICLFFSLISNWMLTQILIFLSFHVFCWWSLVFSLSLSLSLPNTCYSFELILSWQRSLFEQNGINCKQTNVQRFIHPLVNWAVLQPELYAKAVALNQHQHQPDRRHWIRLGNQFTAHVLQILHIHFVSSPMCAILLLH